jgi:isochorismate hydrolase
MQERGVSRLVICGLQTEFCVDTTVRQALPLGDSVTLVADAHSTSDGALRAEQVIAHHNRTLRWMTSYGPRMEVKPAAEVAFGDESPVGRTRRFLQMLIASSR